MVEEVKPMKHCVTRSALKRYWVQWGEKGETFEEYTIRWQTSMADLGFPHAIIGND